MGPDLLRERYEALETAGKGGEGEVIRALDRLHDRQVALPGWKQLREVALPAGSRKANPILIPSVNDVNERGTMVGTIYGLTANDYGSLRRIDPVVWRCQFGS